MNEIKKKGGAKTGYLNSSWPFATLSVNKQCLSLKISFCVSYVFDENQVISIDKYVGFPFMAWGIQIIHDVDCYPEKIIFYTASNPDRLIQKISDVGFTPKAKYTSFGSENVYRNGSPVKILPIVLVIIIWNVLFLVDNKLLSHDPGTPGIFSVIALVFIFITARLIKYNQNISSVFLKHGRHVGEIVPVLNFLMFLTGFMSVIFSVMFIIDGL